MSITDELREYASNLAGMLGASVTDVKSALEDIADSIDAAHQKAMDEWKAKDGETWLHGYSECRAELMDGNEAIAASLEDAGWMKLPKDADGVPIRVGDKVVDWETPRLVVAVSEDSICLAGYESDSYYRMGIAKNYRHHHEPTVEDVLREFGRGWHERMNGPKTFDIADYVERYAAKLRLAGESA